MLDDFYNRLLSNTKDNLFYNSGVYISKEQFLTEVYSYYSYLKEDPNKTIALYIPNNVYLFYVLFMALLHAEKNIVLLSQLSENHLAALNEKTDSIITDQKVTLKSYNCYLPKPEIIPLIDLPRLKDVNIYFYTSGSTSTPKCIRKTLSSLLSEVKMHARIQSYLIEQKPIVLASIVPFHMYGILWRLFFSFFNSLTQDLDTIFYLEEFVEKQSQHDKIIFLTTPSFMTELTKQADTYTYRKNILGIFSSGSLLIDELSHRVNAIFGVSPYEIYGSTETGGVAYRQQSKDNLWHVFPEIEIGRQDNSCLRVESKFSTTPVYNTSDLIELVDKDTFILRERLDRMVKISEKRLSLPEMEKFLNKSPEELSGGQKQRVAIAGILALGLKIIIFDEATSMLDPEGVEDIMHLVREMKKENPELTFISITHDIEEAYLSDRVIILNNGEIFEEGKPEDVFADESKITSIGLDIPFVLKTKNKLSESGIFIPKEIKTIEELSTFLCGK